MNYKTMYKDKLSKMLFLEINQKAFFKSINTSENIRLKNDELYIPISTEHVANDVEDEIRINNLPIYYFIEGMFMALGADENFKFNDDYGCILSYIDNSEQCIKSIIADKVKKNDLQDAYILAKGLYRYNKEQEIMEAILSIGETIREENKEFSELLLQDIEDCKEKFYHSPKPYLYSALISKEEGDYKKAQVEINEYINKGGERTEEIEIIINDINNIGNYEKAIEVVNDEPEKTIKLLLPLHEQFEKNPLIYYYLAVAYRKLDNYDKAIHYLMESLQIESGILEVINELGLNYAYIKNYEQAIKYFKKAFEASNEVGICTNIVMCYIKLGDKKQAKEYLEKAKKIDPKDEIVIEIDQMLGRVI